MTKLLKHLKIAYVKVFDQNSMRNTRNFVELSAVNNEVKESRLCSMITVTLVYLYLYGIIRGHP